MLNVIIQERKYNLIKANIHADNNLINRNVGNQLFQLCGGKYPTEIIVAHATKSCRTEASCETGIIKAV